MRQDLPLRRGNRPGSLYRLVYRSSSAVDPIDPEMAIRDILNVGRRNNSVADITSALLYTIAGFAQVLEGSRDEIERTFDRIATDRRHRDVMVLSFAPAKRRCFPDVAIGLCRAPHAASPLQSVIPARASDLLRFLEDLVQHEESSLAG